MDADMGKATSTRKKKSGGADDALGALEQRQLADFLARAHATLRLWRLCEHKSCRRQRGCRGDVDACGTRCAKDRWAFVRHVLESIAAGRTRREAVRFAGRGNCKELRILFGFGEPLDMLVNEDGSWSHPDQVASRLNFGTQFKRLTRCGSALLRKVPRVAAKT
jgi:hypothetical protein